MNRRAFLKSLAATAATTALSSRALSAAAPTKPNILFIFADDFAPDAIGALGNPDLKTPNFDRLVKNGTSFTRAYIPGSWTGAVCIASRTMLMTGQPCWQAQRLNLSKEAAAGRFWPKHMESAGYSTWYSGKWHMDSIKPAEAFQTVLRIRPGGMPPVGKEQYNRPLDGKPDPWNPADPAHRGHFDGGKHWCEVQADDAIQMLTNAKSDNKPFFMYLPFNSTHDPRQAPQQYLDMYPLDSIKLPSNFMPAYPWRDEIGNAHNTRDENLAPMPRTELAVKTHRREYYAMISHFDAQVGRVLDALEKSGQADNTIISFAGDNGLAVGRHGLIGKQNMFEHSARVPLVIAGPGIPKGQTRDALVYLQDITPTTLDLAGLPIPSNFAFRSLLPLLRNPSAPKRQYIYGAYLQDRQRMVADDTFKLILYPRVPKALLFNLKSDPDELKDLSDDPTSKPIMKRLMSALLKLQKESGDTLDLVAKFPDLAP